MMMSRRSRFALASMLIVVLAVGTAGLWVLHWSDSPLPVTEDGLTFRVEQGDSLASVSERLAEAGALRYPYLMTLYGRLRGDAGRIHVGEYAIGREATPRRLLDRLVAGRVVQYSLTVIEGWTFRQMLDAVQDHQALEHHLEGLEPAEILDRIGATEDHPEGLFYPDTYHFPRGETDVAFLRRAYRTMQEHLADAWTRRVEDLPLEDPYDALIMASIVEKETSLDEEKARISGVFVRRLRRGMRLQTDPTVIYGIGENFDGDIRFRDLKRDTPYNTYTRHGLPPTPIALPGKEALLAAVQPAPGDALYFVARGDGSHQFSSTIEEHNEAVRRYQLRGDQD